MMNPRPFKLKVSAISHSRLIPLSLAGLTPVGGRRGTGVCLDELKHDGDYLVLVSTESGVSIHPLRGAGSGTTQLGAGQVYRLEDLTITVENFEEPRAVTAQSAPADLGRLHQILIDVANQANSRRPLEGMLRELMRVCDHSQGLVISQGMQGGYEILAAENLDATQAWLSESLVQQALRTQEPIIIQNVIGSGFDSQKSLMATKFLSVFCWPLVVQGTVLGVLISGSQRPYAGVFEQVRDRAEVYVHLAALLLDFRLRELRLQREVREFRAQMGDGPFLTENPKVQSVCELAKKVAPSDLSVLIQGETGVGKEVLSRWIHQQSRAVEGPFVALNCAAIPAELLESTLFGHKRGAFTGAVSDRLGKLQQAHGGTIFLDEIGDLPLALQAKLLRVLQDQCVEPVGSNKSVQVDVRVICASHKDIHQLVSQGRFRDDLYYRLAQVTLLLPPLRERLGDIRLLAQQFLKELDSEKHLAPDAWTWLLSQRWQGNIRELKSAIHRAAVLADGKTLHAVHFNAGSHSFRSIAQRDGNRIEAGREWLGAKDLESAKQEFILQKIGQALEITQGNRTRAAEILGVTSRTLFRYLEQKSATDLS